MTPEELNVNDVTLAAAYQLRDRCPWIVFTSGKRSFRGQAHAMAKNALVKRTWIGEVYKKFPEFQEFVTAHPEILDLTEMTNGLYGVLISLSSDRQARFAHPAARAFDVGEPKPENQEDTANVIETLPGLEIFLPGEAGLPIWHAQFLG
jgi:hypothetical protein